MCIIGYSFLLLFRRHVQNQYDSHQLFLEDELEGIRVSMTLFQSIREEKKIRNTNCEKKQAWDLYTQNEGKEIL